MQKRGGGKKNPKILWTTYLEAPYVLIRESFPYDGGTQYHVVLN